MPSEISKGDLVKLRGMTKGEFPIGIVLRVYPNSWSNESSYADITWSNPAIAARWAVSTPIAVRNLEKIS